MRINLAAPRFPRLNLLQPKVILLVENGREVIEGHFGLRFGKICQMMLLMFKSMLWRGAKVQTKRVGARSWISDQDLVLRPLDCRVIENILQVSEIVYEISFINAC